MVLVRCTVQIKILHSTSNFYAATDKNKTKHKIIIYVFIILEELQIFTHPLFIRNFLQENSQFLDFYDPLPEQPTLNLVKSLDNQLLKIMTLYQSMRSNLNTQSRMEFSSAEADAKDSAKKEVAAHLTVRNNL